MLGAVLTVAWMTGLRGFMQQLASPDAGFTFCIPTSTPKLDNKNLNGPRPERS